MSMKHCFTISILLILFTCQSVFGQKPDADVWKRNEVYFSFQIHSQKDIQSITSLISIDNVKGNTVWAYANMNQFLKFSKLGYNITLLPHPGDAPGVVMKDKILLSPLTTWDVYPTYSGYVDLMNQFQAQYPAICQVQTIATLPSGHKILVAKISDNVATDEPEPEFLYTSSIHGDETTGYVLMLHLIDYLLSNYGTNPDITDLVNNMEIYINPLANPDGTYHGGDNSVSGATRYNANSVDLNRNYPDPQAGQHPDGNAWQPETVAFMDFATQHHFVASANFHGGVEVVNYPWDTWAALSADDDWWQYVSREYADAVHLCSPAGYMTYRNNGVTNGYAWYQVTGGRQDYMNYVQHCREYTIELSNTKLLPAAQLPAHWDYNWRSFILYMKEARYGIQGIITNQITGLPVAAKVFIAGHDNNNSEVYSSANPGDYHRLLKGGTYTLTISATNYITKTITGVVVTDHATTNLDIPLMPIIPTVTTQPATSVTTTSAVLNGSVNPNGYATTYHFDWGTTAGYGNSTTNTSAGSGTTASNVISNISGLTQGTTYHCRVVATNSNGTANGNDVIFFYGMPVVSTTSATSITATTATSGGSITSQGGSGITSRGICWSINVNPDISGGHSTDGTGTGTFTSNLTGLTPTVTYHIRAYATNSYGTSYGNDLQFTTLTGIPTVTTTTPTSITNASAVSGGNVTSIGGSSVIARGICWSTFANPTIAGNHTTDGSGIGSYSSSLTGLAPNTTYHVAAYATNSWGTSYGNDLSFTTLCGSITFFPWNEGFENNGSIPNCWTQEQVNSSGVNWTFIAGSGSSYPSTAHVGSFNACLKDATGADNKTKLISPTIDLSSLGSPVLKFWHTQAVWSGDQDQLIVYYRTLPSGSWTTLATYTTSILSWTMVTLNLPTSSSTVNIAFEGNAKYGYGVCIDDVSITGTVIPTLSVSPAGQNITSVAGSTSFGVTSNSSWTASSSQSWCLVTNSGTGNGTIAAAYTANTAGSTRVANITVTVSGVTPVVVTVTQAAAPTKTLNLSSVFLEGLYNGNSTMIQARDASGVHWTDGSADHVTIELHNPVTYGTIEYTVADVPLSTTGTATINIPPDKSGNYYLTIRHRNSIETLSALPVSFAGTTINYAFDASSKAYGNNMTFMLETNGVTLSPPLIYAGDVDQDGSIEAEDINQVGNAATKFGSGYIPQDVNGDGQVESSDLNMTGNNSTAFIGTIKPL